MVLVCVDCGAERDEPKRRQGYPSPRCEECRKARERERKRARHAANRERERARNRAYVEANRDRVQERRRSYREANRDTLSEKRRAYYSANRDRAIELWHARRAAEAGVPVFVIVPKDWRRLLAATACAYCGADDGPLTVDHVVPLARGGRHSIGNVVAACLPCNQSKSDRLLSEWRLSKARRAAVAR